MYFNCVKNEFKFTLLFTSKLGSTLEAGTFWSFLIFVNIFIIHHSLLKQKYLLHTMTAGTIRHISVRFSNILFSSATYVIYLLVIHMLFRF